MRALLHIKVCGMKHASNLEEVCALGPDYVGFIFVAGSPRYVGADPDPALFTLPGRGIGRAGVFVDQRQEVILEQLQKDRIDLVQLHGNEHPAYCRLLKEKGLRIIKALPSARLETGEGLEIWKDAVDFLLLDSPSAGQGGSGMKFDWALLERAQIPVPFFLSGGIVPEDAGAIKELGHPQLLAVDVNSGFESAPGMKDVGKLESFIKEIRAK